MRYSNNENVIIYGSPRFTYPRGACAPAGPLGYKTWAKSYITLAHFCVTSCVLYHRIPHRGYVIKRAKRVRIRQRRPRRAERGLPTIVTVFCAKHCPPQGPPEGRRRLARRRRRNFCITGATQKCTYVR